MDLTNLARKQMAVESLKAKMLKKQNKLLSSWSPPAQLSYPEHSAHALKQDILEKA